MSKFRVPTLASVSLKTIFLFLVCFHLSTISSSFLTRLNFNIFLSINSCLKSSIVLYSSLTLPLFLPFIAGLDIFLMVNN